MRQLLTNDPEENYIEKRASLCAALLHLADKSADRGEFLLAGGIRPSEGALLMFSDESAEKIFASPDCYVRIGIVADYGTHADLISKKESILNQVHFSNFPIDDPKRNV